MFRPFLAIALIAAASGLPLLAVVMGWNWYLDGPLLLLVAVAGGYAAGAWLPPVLAAAAVVPAVAALVVTNQLDQQGYHWLDDTVFFVVVVCGSAGAGAAVTLRARQVRRLERLAAELDEQQRVEVAAARLEEQNRVHQDVHTRLAERIAGIALRAEGAQRAPDEEALAVVEAEARGVLDQLRAALGTLAPEAAVIAAEPTRPEAAPRDRISPLDLGLAAMLGVALAVETIVHSLARGPAWANVVASLLVAAPLVLRRSRPLLAVGASLLAAIAMSAWLTPVPATVTGVGLLVVVFYTVGAWCSSWWWVPGWFMAAGGAVVMEEVSGLADDGDAGDAGWIVLVWMVAAVLVGRVAAGWQERVRRTADLGEALERGRGAAVRLATARTREELASELHDSVAHAMTVVCLQAGAQRRAPADPGAALQIIATTAAASLAELRDGLDAIETTERPLDAARLAALGRRIGIDVAVSEALPAPTGLAAALAFRVVREAIVNVARHAAGSAADVSVMRAERVLRVEVVDRGGEPGPVEVGTGSGLTGLAGVVAGAGGSLTWGPRDGGGFRVVAEIPEEER